MTMTVLITGFGPFPGARFNPTGPLARHLARMRRPAFAGIHRIAHVFATSYANVDRELPALIAGHRPDIVLMFGLAARTPHLRVEMVARNAVSPLLSDIEGCSGRTIAVSAPSQRRTLSPAVHLLRAAQTARVPAKLSRDAGRYLCNYAFWRGLEAATQPNGPRIVAFIHVPKLRQPRTHARALASARGRGSERQALTHADIARSGEAILRALLIAARN